MDIKRFKMFSDFQRKDFLTDVKVKLKNGTINAHKIVLAANSEFFKVLFSNTSCKEATTGIVDLPCIECETFSYILDSIYFRNEEEYLIKDISFYIDVIIASDFLGMLDFINYIDFKMAENFNVSLLKDYEKILCYNLNKTARKYEMSIIELISKKKFEEIVNIPGETLLRLIERDSFAIDENVLFDFFIFFHNKNKENICTTIFEKLFNSIRVPLLDRKHLAHFEKFKSESEVNMLDVKESPSEPRCVTFLFVVKRTQNIVNIDKIDLVNNDIIAAIDSPSPAYNFCRVFGHHLIMMRESIKCDDYFGSIINLASSRLTSIEPLECALPEVDYFSQYNKFALLFMDTYLLVTGGYFFSAGVSTPSKSIIRYNITGADWKIDDDVCLPEACWSHAMARDSEKPNLIYFCGGRNQQTYLKTVYSIDLVTREIKYLQPLQKETYGHRMECYKGHVFVFDSNHIKKILILDLAHSVWHKIDLTVVGAHLHLGYCIAVPEDSPDDSDTLIFYELTRNVPKDKVSIYCRKVSLSNIDKLITDVPTLVVQLPDRYASDIHIGRAVYGSSPVSVSPHDEFVSTFTSDSD